MQKSTAILRIHKGHGQGHSPDKTWLVPLTVETLQKSGILYGNAGALDGLIDRINEELGTTCTVVATGGLAGVIAPLCRHHMILDDDLLLKGLNILYQKNTR